MKLVASLTTLALMIESSTAFVAPTLKTSKSNSVVSSPDSSSLSVLPLDVLDAFGSSSNVLASTNMESVTSSPLFTYFAEKVIDASIPAIFSAAVIFIFFSQLKKTNKGDDEEEGQETATALSELYNDLYSSSRSNNNNKNRMKLPFGPNRSPPPLPKNIGIPSREFLKITNMNERFDAYDFSLTKATESKAKAAADFRVKAFDRALGLALNAEPSVEGSTVAEFLAPRVKAKLIRIEKQYLQKAKDKFADLQKTESTLAAVAMDAKLMQLGEQMEKSMQDGDDALKVIDAEVDTAETTTTAKASDDNKNKKKNKKKDDTAILGPKKEELIKEASKLQTELKELELDFIQEVLGVVGPKRAAGLRNTLLGNIAVRGATGSLLLSIEERPLSALLKTSTERPKSVYVMDFPGDVQASQLNELREEVTGVIRNAQPGDEALVILQSGGGTVTGYGLAAGQLARIKEKGLKLTIAVEQVAASGGYMMSCVADKIIASPFAVIGSIGVISEVPNVYNRLKEEGIQFQTVTAGKFKRTLTPTKKITKEDLTKSEEDIAEIFELFKGWVAQNRPQLNIDEVATGETWFGPAALEKGLCDEIKTVDDVLLDYIAEGCNVYSVKYAPPPEIPNNLQALFATSSSSASNNDNDSSIGRKAIRWLVQSFAEEVKAVTTSSMNTPLEQKYMAQDDTQDRVKASSDDSYYY
eukprot:CAMPEP_0194234170 /NCGR_PEP_ID=MMETSP0158-20130606/1943_1 /TAXON_ID=33649 /ORGANISM="Thalassionema nitzschioides, Strain L26-B" /LENGTH=698 /DNA_ID=CAMNT_0038967255 /DNA_START=82 /DNA_END=2178 /DNA_ORIENTATION=+